VNLNQETFQATRIIAIQEEGASASHLVKATMSFELLV